MKLLAHLTIVNGDRKEQTLKEHCIRTANYAAETVQTAGFYHTAYLAGVLHDMGKGTRIFNEYLENSFKGEDAAKGSVNHTFAGVIYLLEKYHNEVTAENRWECLTSEIIAYAVGAHHGVFDCIDLDGKNGFEHRLTKERKELFYEEACMNYFHYVIKEPEIDELFQMAVEEIKKFFSDMQKILKCEKERFFQLGMLCRLILSAVIYGDRRDTAEFMTDALTINKQTISWKQEREFVEERLSHMDAGSLLNQVRREISGQCAKFSANSTGIYRLNIPTGAGKTLCSLRYSLSHAEQYQKKKIIFIIPLLSILDQNAKVIKDYVTDSRLVLEHHSNVVYEKEKQREEADSFELMAENWDAPIIITTMVQFLNTLFKQQTSAIGRMRALCDSVIVIDEVQTLPPKVILMFNAALNFLNRYGNATIILSSATQPCFEQVEWPIQYALNADMVRLSESQKAVFKRAEIINKSSSFGMDQEELAEFCAGLTIQHNSLLIICNTKTEARRLFRNLQTMTDEDEVLVYYLSNAMCQAHRMCVLDEVQKMLTNVQKGIHCGKKEKKVICVSTQLVEAGVDFSFEGVVRVMAGVDNLIQSAGRCNRSDEYLQKGKEYFVNIKNEDLSRLPEIMYAKKAFQRVLEDLRQAGSKDYTGDDAVHAYYQYFFQEIRKELKYPIKDWGSEYFLAMLLANVNEVSGEKNKSYIMRYPFKTAGQKFRVFEEDTIDILVPYQEGITLVKEIKNMDEKYLSFEKVGSVLRKVKAYTVSIYQWQKDKLLEYGLLEECLGGRIFVLSEKAYHMQYGLGKIEAQNVSDFFV